MTRKTAGPYAIGAVEIAPPDYGPPKPKRAARKVEVPKPMPKKSVKQLMRESLIRSGAIAPKPSKQV